MASARQRDGRWTGLYRDRDGRQRSAGTFDSKASALKAARASEAVEAAGVMPASPWMDPNCSSRT